eukprot:364212-Chlamydomonas_euryale.AAC.9
MWHVLARVMVRGRTLQWMEHILRTAQNRLLRHVVDCWLAQSVAEDGHLCTPGCHEEGCGGGTTFQNFLKTGRTKLNPRAEIRAAAAERASDRQA